MNRIHYTIVFLSLMAQAVATLPSDGELNCLPNEVQFNASGQIHFGGQSTEPRFFLVRNQFETPLILDFPKGHIGASAGLTQMLASRAWAVYVYKPGADTLPTAEGMTAPFWSCRSGNNTDCRHSVWTCALTADAAAKIISSRYQQQANSLTHSFWLPLGNAQYQSVNFLTDLEEN